jgi:hypothetical protein
VIAYIETRIRAWVSWRVVIKPRVGQAGYYSFRTLLGDLRAEGSTAAGTAAPGSRTKAITGARVARLLEEDREPLEVELVMRNLPAAMCTLALLSHVGVTNLGDLDVLDRRPEPYEVSQLEAVLMVSRATVYNRIHALHAVMLDQLNEPRLDGLIDHVMRIAALDILRALRQNRPHSAKVGIATAAA